MGRVLSRVFEGVRSSPPKCLGSPPKLLLFIRVKSNYIGKISPEAKRSVHMKAFLRTLYDKEHDHD